MKNLLRRSVRRKHGPTQVESATEIWTLSTKGGAYWVDGACYAEEQVVFLKKLYRNDLPFELEHQRLLKDVMRLKLRKTGYYVRKLDGKAHRLVGRLGRVVR